MRSSRLTLLIAASLLSQAGLTYGDHQTGSYPRVRTFSGGYYGPTQAHYQYQRRYGRPWHGEGGLSTYRGGGYGPRSYSYGGFGYGFPYATGGWGYSSYYRGSFFGPVCNWISPWVSYPLGVTVVQPSLVLQQPAIYTPLPSTNPLANDALLQNGALLQQQLPDLVTPNVQLFGAEPVGDPNVSLLPPSTPQAKLRSLQHQQRGDVRMHNVDYFQASLRYQDAIKAAADRVEPHYRLGVALAGRKQFDEAVRELKTATSIDPSWIDSITLGELLGEDQLMAKTQLKQRVAEWTLGDAYDADRLYLLGTLLYLDGDPQRAGIMLKTAAALVGWEPHLTAFRLPSTATPQPPTSPTSNEPVPPLPPLPAPDGSAPPDLPPAPADVVPSNNAAGILPSLKQPAGPVFPSTF